MKPKLYNTSTLCESDDKEEQIEYICRKILKSNYIDSKIESKTIDNKIHYRIEVIYQQDNEYLTAKTNWNCTFPSLYNTLCNVIATSIMLYRLDNKE